MDQKQIDQLNARVDKLFRVLGIREETNMGDYKGSTVLSRLVAVENKFSDWGQPSDLEKVA